MTKSLSDFTLPPVPASWPGIFRWNITVSQPMGTKYYYLTLQTYKERKTLIRRRKKGKWVNVASDMLLMEYLDQHHVSDTARTVLRECATIYASDNNAVMAERTY